MVRTLGHVATAALLTVAVAGTAPAWAAEKPAKQRQMKFSPPVQALLVKAQEAQKGGNDAAALPLLDQAETAAKTPDDKYMINMLRLNSAIALKDNASIEKALKGALDSGQVPAEEQPKFIRNLGAMAMQRNDFATAMQYFEQLAQINPNDTEVMLDLAELQRRQGQPARAVQTVQAAIASKEKQGQKADEQWYRRALGIAYDSKLAAETATSGKALLAAYPNPTNWRDVLTIYRDSNKFDDQMNLDVLRLMRASNALSGERDFVEYAETASLRGFPGEAKSVLDEGIAKGALQAGRPVVKELSATVTPKIAADRAALPGLEKEAAAAKTGRAALGTADAYLGYGDYAKAAALYKMALAKGGVDADIANLRMGLALGKSGDKAAARAAFEAVAGEPRKTLASYYLIWLAQQA
jgi:tetratricopeptide (TPR) repeat protein